MIDTQLKEDENALKQGVSGCFHQAPDFSYWLSLL